MKNKAEAGSVQADMDEEKRHFSRVITKYANCLTLGGVSYRAVKIRNLSISGCFISGTFPASVCDTCQIELYKNDQETAPIVTLSARVIRVEEDGLALVFVELDDRSLMLLQTLVLYSTDDPMKVAGEFVNDIKIYGDGGCQ